MKTASALLLAALLATPVVAQTPGPTATPTVTSQAPTAPTLSEGTELRRQNLVLRANLLQAQLEALNLRLAREKSEIDAALASLRATVEKDHPGWTVSEDGSVSAVTPPKPTPKP